VWFGEERFRARLAAPIVFVLLSVPIDSYLRSPIILALGLFLAASAFTPVLKTLSHRVPDGLVRQGSRLRIAAAVWLVCTIPVLVFEHRQLDQREQAWTDEWQTIGVWAGENTPVNAVFMNPVVKANIPPYTDEEVGGLGCDIQLYCTQACLGWLQEGRSRHVVAVLLLCLASPSERSEFAGHAPGETRLRSKKRPCL
jgi:hypothetical protein